MRIAFNTSLLVLALLAATLCAGSSVAAAAADTSARSGGASAPAAGAAGSLAPAGTIRPTGIATWFGPGFYGKQTACGQKLTPAVLGVANRTLPCGTLVKVGYAGHTLTVPVLDRGPYGHIGADWDLTAGAAQALDITETVRIHTRVVGSAPNTPLLGQPVGVPTAVIAGGSLAG